MKDEKKEPITIYRIVSGTKEGVESETNELAKNGWIYCGGNVSMINTEAGIWYSHLMSKYIPSPE